MINKIIKIEETIFTLACNLDELKEGIGTRIILEDRLDIAVFKVSGSVFAVSNICPHQKAPVIYKGAIDNGAIYCPLHNQAYYLSSGLSLENKAKLKTFQTLVVEKYLYIETPPEIKPKWAL